MERVPQRVLNWLHSVLIGDYFDVNRTFADVAQTLENYNTFRPTTDVYTFENGSSALLVHLTGTVPVSFRGGRYSFPVSIWIPRTYPNEAPIAFVAPTQEMILRPGQHVSGEGRIYHPYLANWRAQSQVSDLVTHLQGIFSREPPVVAKSSSSGRPPPTSPTSAPPRPPLPSGLRKDPVMSPRSNGAPPPPPKPFEQHPNSVQSQPPIPARPALQTPLSHPQTYSPTSPQPWHQISDGVRRIPQSTQNYSQYMTSPAQLHQPQIAQMQPVNVHLPLRPSYNHHESRQPTSSQPPLHPGQYQQQNVQHLQQSQVPLQPEQRKQTLDLLTSPFDPPLPAQSVDLPAPPIPPNPEKDALLSAISHSLTIQLRSNIAANASALQPLSAQHIAMINALQNLQEERNALLYLQSLLDSNENILHQAMRDADECIASAHHKAVPGVDEVLVAPTIVGQQLYDLISDMKACVDTREVLARALDRGRISSETWVKTVRSLAREEFLKKTLIRRCAEGMGLQKDVT